MKNLTDMLYPFAMVVHFIVMSCGAYNVFNGGVLIVKYGQYGLGACLVAAGLMMVLLEVFRPTRRKPCQCGLCVDRRPTTIPDIKEIRERPGTTDEG